MENTNYFQLDEGFLVCITSYPSSEKSLPALSHKLYFTNGKIERDDLSIFKPDTSELEMLEAEVTYIHALFPFAKDLNEEEFLFEIEHANCVKVLKSPEQKLIRLH